jgi:hypothetical protein
MAIRAYGYGVIDRILTALRQWNPMVHLEVWLTIGSLSKGGRLFTKLAPAGGAI